MDLREASMELALRFAHVWWAGFKVLCRWFAFYIVLGALWLPLAGIAYLVQDYTDGTFIVILAVLIAPVGFYLASRYLLLLGDEDHPQEPTERPAEVSERRDYGLRRKIAMSAAAAYAATVVLTPSPDPYSALVAGAPAAAVLCGVSLLILSRLRFVRSASKPMQTLICVLVCLISALAMSSWWAAQAVVTLHDALAHSSPPASAVSSSP